MSNGKNVVGGAAFDERLKDIIREIAKGTGESSAIKLGSLAVDRLRKMAEDGDVWALWRLRAAPGEAFATAAQRVLKEQYFAVRPGAGAAGRSVPLNAGVRLRGDDGKLEPHFQQLPLVDLDWGTFEAYVARRRESWRAEDGRLRVLEGILALRPRYADTRTPREALEAAGMTVELAEAE